MEKMMKNNVKHLALAIGLGLGMLATGSLVAQDASPKLQNPPAEGQGREDRGSRVFGTIASVGVDRFEVKTRDGASQTVMVNNQTHYRQDQKDIHLEDLKAGDRVFVRGEANANKDFVAVVVNRVTDEDIKRMQQMQGHRAFGEITAIEGNQLKIQNRRQGDRTIVVNDQTRFMKDGQPIMLKDLKVGDRILAMGDETNGQFVATRVMTGQFRRGEGRGRPEN